MSRVVAILLSCLLLAAACGSRSDKEELYGLPGAWTLRFADFPAGQRDTFPKDGNTFCRIFSKDTTFYDCQLLSTPSGVVIIPGERGDFEIIEKGNNEMLYIENGHLRPLERIDDTTLVIQKYGIKYTWVLNHSMSETRMEEIKNIIAHDNSDANEEVMRYVLSVSERELKATNRFLVYLLIVSGLVVLFVLNYVYLLFRRKQHVERQLQKIQEEQALRPMPVQKAFREVEQAFFSSAYFTSLHKRIAAGELLKPTDWDEMEQEMKPVYPVFFRQLPSLCKMSAVEYRVCLLIKLHFSPSEIAGVLCKDISTISSIRNRLYKKVFGRSGGAKGWDDFILSL